MRTRHSWQRRLRGVTLGLALLAVPGMAAAVCGDGSLDLGEHCDPGPDVATDCCTAGCTITSATPAFVCRPVADLCDVAEVCNGVSDTCPADSVAGAVRGMPARRRRVRPGGELQRHGHGLPGRQRPAGRDGVRHRRRLRRPGHLPERRLPVAAADGDGDSVCDACDTCPARPQYQQDRAGFVTNSGPSAIRRRPPHPVQVRLRLINAPFNRDPSYSVAKGTASPS